LRVSKEQRVHSRVNVHVRSQYEIVRTDFQSSRQAMSLHGMQIYDSSRQTVNIRSHLTFNNYREASQIQSRALEETEKEIR
jgi:hypothetical protein